MTYPSWSTGELLSSSDMNRVGLWRIGSVTATNTTIALDNVFTTTFSRYRIFVTQTNASVTGTTLFRFRAGGAAIATNDYYYGGHVYYYNTVPGSWYAGPTSSFPTIIATGGNQTQMVIDLSFPRDAQRKGFVAQQTNSFSNYIGSTTHGIVNLTATNYDGFQLTQDAGATLTATAIVYGYNQVGV